MATGRHDPGVNPQGGDGRGTEGGGGGLHKPCASHAQGREGIINAVRGGIDSIEHGIYMDEVCVEEMMARGTYLVPTLAAIRNILGNRDRGIPAYVVEKSEIVAEVHKHAIQLFYKAGGKIAMGTDAGTPFNLHGENALELAYMVDVGISPADAIQIATRNAAALNRYEDRGRLAEGCYADLLLVEGDPLAEIARVAEKRHHRLVVKNGRPVA